MPTYQYACKQPACGHQFEAVQSFSDDPITVCPVCEGQVRKVFSAVGVVFKGSGFYRNDSRENAKSSNGSSSVKDNGSGGKKADSTSSSSADSSGAGSSNGSSSNGSSPTTSASFGSSSGSTSKAAAS